MSIDLAIEWQGRKISGVIFDVDGTLTDSIETYYKVFADATSEFGLNIKREDVLDPMATGNLIWDHAIPQSLPDRGEIIKKITKAIVEIFPKEFSKVALFPGVGRIITGLSEASIKIGAVTSSWGPVFDPLHKASLSQYFDVYISREDGFPLKPAPDGILDCLKRMDVRPENAVIVGDTTMDIEAGKSAGTYTIGVLSGLAQRSQMEAEPPDAIIDSVEDLCGLFGIEAR